MSNPKEQQSFFELRTICPATGSAVEVRAVGSRAGVSIVDCSRWKDGFTCKMGCACQVDLEHSVQLARGVQELFEPVGEFEFGEVSVATRMLVSQRVGGDFQVVRAYGPIVRVIQGDVVGKGLNAALLAAYLVGLCDALTGEGLKPARVLHSMNIALAERTDARPMFATVVAIEADLVLRTWSCARAGHELPLLVRAAGPEMRLNELPSLPVGVDPNEVYVEQVAPLLDGDRLFVASDGTVEVGLTSEMTTNALRYYPNDVCSQMQNLMAQLPFNGPLQDDVTLAIIGIQRG